MSRIKITPKKNSLVRRTTLLLDELKEYIDYLKRRVDTQNQLIQPLQQTVDAYLSFVRDWKACPEVTWIDCIERFKQFWHLPVWAQARVRLEICAKWSWHPEMIARRWNEAIPARPRGTREAARLASRNCTSLAGPSRDPRLASLGCSRARD